MEEEQFGDQEKDDKDESVKPQFEVKKERQRRGLIETFLLGMNPSQRLTLSVVAVLNMGILFMVLVFFTSRDSAGINASTIAAVAGAAVTLLMGTATYMLRYLETSQRSYVTLQSATKSHRDNILSITRKIGGAFLPPDGNRLNDDERSKLIAKLESSISDYFKTELAAEMERRFAKDVVENLHNKSMEAIFSSARARLISEIESLMKRGNLNLVLGSLTTLTGLVLLGIFVFTAQAHSDGMGLISYHIPRITLVVFVQLFGFFFLRLYKSSLEGIKYFQNELTNVEIKYLAVKGAMLSGNPKAISAIVGLLSKTERNFILLKGQTTVEIEKTKLDGDQYKDIISALGEIQKAKKP